MFDINYKQKLIYVSYERYIYAHINYNQKQIYAHINYKQIYAHMNYY